ncbi:hypothetical protein Ahy_A08g037656 [Arachis hypogaea]|uniref:Uncharacterized protein n=1 Tax=Arachis hypogaea TaxID=3818 RepID=A0A445BRE6_ARAHY|nr:hypothetical protein Ahy_A08g037656 [Arachis hypogaea]
MHPSDFLEYANIGIVVPKDEEFRIEMKYIVATIRSYTISRGVNHTVYESETQMFYTKFKIKVVGRYGDTTGGIRAPWEQFSQGHCKLDSNTIAEAIRPLVETNLILKVKSMILEVQSTFNYTISYRKA